MDLAEFAKVAAERRASDIFIKADAPPAVRVDGRVTPLEFPPLTGDEVRQLAYSIMTNEQIGRFERRHELDLAFTLENIARFRANIYEQRGSAGMVLRIIPLGIYTVEDLGLPTVIRDLAMPRQGLVLVTGPTGSGKSTTLAAMINVINKTRSCHIVTIEDPIEFIHGDEIAVISQREVGIDTDSFTDALKYVVRQSPDIILIGEMRDVETMNVAMAAAETGHLVFSTIHTTSASETLDRIINMFPPHDKPQVCLRLATSLRGIISQKLLPKKSGPGRIAALEIMVANPTVSKLIEEGRSGQLHVAISEGAYWGMRTMNQCLASFVREDVVSEEEALEASQNVTELRQMLRKQ